MKFEQYMNREAVPEWRPKYIDYRVLKGHLKGIPLQCRDLAREHAFMRDLCREQEKARKFFLEKETTLQAKFQLCKHTQQTKKSYKACLINLYTEIDLLRSFRSLNEMAARKIVKKFTKVTGTGGEDIEVSFTFNSRWLELVGQEIEDAFTRLFCSGDRHRAMRQLRTTSSFENETFYTAAMIGGLTWGVSLSGAFYIVLISSSSSSSFDLLNTLMSQFLPFLVIGLFSINIFLFKGAFVNFRFVFQFNKRNVLHEAQYVCLSGLLAFTFVFTAVVVGIKGPAYLPLLATLIVALNPFGPYNSARFWFFQSILRVLTAPFHSVLFKDFFIADHLISLAWFLQSIPNSFYSGSKDNFLKLTLPMIPILLRILQCLRRFSDTRIKMNLLNAFKYGLVMICFASRNSGIFIIESRIFSIVLVILQFGTSLFSLWWDYFMDFGMRLDGLREHLCFQKPVYYYILLFDFFSRFFWIWMPFMKEKPYEKLFFALIETVRRFNWSLLRIEFEHLNNCNAFRAVEELKLMSAEGTADLFYNDMVKEADNNEYEYEETEEN